MELVEMKKQKVKQDLLDQITKRAKNKNHEFNKEQTDDFDRMASDTKKINNEEKTMHFHSVNQK